jgi:hypothetical protein
LSGNTDIYDALAPHYREYAGGKSAYLAAVDRFVLENLPAGADSLLDVGAGDGVRAMALAREAGIRRGCCAIRAPRWPPAAAPGACGGMASAGRSDAGRG